MPHYSKHIRGLELLDDNVNISGTRYYYIEVVFGDPVDPDNPSKFFTLAELFRQTAFDGIEQYITVPPAVFPNLKFHHTDLKLPHDGEDRYVIDKVTVVNSIHPRLKTNPWEFNTLAKVLAFVLAVLTGIIIYLLR